MDSFAILKDTLIEKSVTLVAVSKTKPNESILKLYEQGQRIFGENKVQEVVAKYESLPKDIEWHLIGHLQSNKVKYIAPFITMIHSVDSIKLAKEINKQAGKNDRTIDVLIQVKIAEEETKFGSDLAQTNDLIQYVLDSCPHLIVKGFMGMATFTEDDNQVKAEFSKLNDLYTTKKASIESIDTLSMGMSGDYKLAIESGSNMVRIGSLLFGTR